MGPLVFRGFGKCVCVLVLMVCFVFVACCWVSRATLVVLLITPLCRQDLLVGVVCWGGVLCENCIVDANAIIMATAIIYCCCLFFFFCGFVLGIFCCLCVIDVLCFLFFRRTVDALVC